MGLTKPETTFSGFLAVFPLEAEPTTTGGHTISVAFKLGTSCVDSGHIIGLAAVNIPRGISWAVIRESFELATE